MSQTRNARRAARKEFRPPETGDHATILRSRLEQAVAEYGAGGGSPGQAAFMLLQAAALCGLMGSWKDEEWFENAEKAMRRERQAFADAGKRGGTA